MVGNVEGDTHQEGEIIRRNKNSWLVDGLISFDEFLRYFDLPDEGLHKQHNFYTLSGFIMYIIRRIPETGERFEWSGYRFEVIDMDGLRIGKVLVTKL